MMQFYQPQGDYAVKLTIRNARILRAIRTAGHKSQSAFARAEGIHINSLNNIIGMRECPVGADGRLKVIAQQLCDALCALPEDLWSHNQLYVQLERNTYETVMTEEEAFAVVHKKEQATMIIGALKTLTKRQQEVITSRFGLGNGKGKTGEEVARAVGVSVTMIRVNEQQALKHLRENLSEKA